MGKFHEEKIKIMKKYLSDIATSQEYYIGGSTSNKQINAAIKSFAPGLNISTILGFYDTTVFGSGKRGCIFTDDTVYYLEILEKPKKFWYDDIKYLKLEKEYKKDNEKELRIVLNDGTETVFTEYFMNKTPLLKFLNEMKEFDVQEIKRQQNISYSEKRNWGSEASGKKYADTCCRKGNFVQICYC